MSPKKKLALIFALTVFAGLIAMPKEIFVNINAFGLKIDKITRPSLNLNFGRISIQRNLDLVLGLDLAGGSRLAFEVDTSGIEEERKKTALDAAKNIIERRVNLFGVSEPNVQTSSFEGTDRIIVELPGVTNPKDAVDLIGRTAQLGFAEVSAEDGGLKDTDLTGADLKSSSIVFDQTTGKPAVSIDFTNDGGKKFEEITGRNIGNALPILLDGEPVSAPVVQDKITGGSAQITGDFSLDEAKNLSIQLNSGALPVPIKLVEERTVGASLGSQSVEKSVKAGIVGIIMVCIFMLLLYRKFGIIANTALLIFGILTLAIYKLIPIVLTLPGIAGFMLSVGMAVDSNILIFERFKEEKDKRPLSDALEVSFGRAWDSIRDANIATLITAFILANPLDWNLLHISGPVRGFALTLALGIGISLFTGIVVTRNMIRVFIKTK